MAQPKRPRQVDVARLAGVSSAVVSQVLSGRAGSSIRVAPETRQRVWDAIRELGYVPNPVAQSLARGQSRLLGVFTYEAVFPEQQRGFYYPFLLGVEEEAEALGYDLILFTSTSEEEGRRNIFRDGTNRLRLADGAVLLGKSRDRTDLVRLLDEGYPFVFIGRREVEGSAVPFVAADYVAATRDAMARLHRMGHRDIALIATGDPSESARDRETGFRAGTGELGLQGSTVVHDGSPSPAVLRRLVDVGVTAILTENDAIARSVLGAATGLGLTVPSSLSIALLGDPLEPSHDDVDWTMFRIPRREMGREAVRMLLERIAAPDEPPRQASLACQWVSGSTAAARGSGAP